jgi:hypothetical protein
MIVPVREEMKKFGYSLDGSFLVSDRKIIVESPCPLLKCTVPPFDVVSYSECLFGQNSNPRFSNAYLYHGAWSTITTGLFLHDSRASFATLIVDKDDMALVHCTEIASLRARSKHIATYLILPFCLIFVSSKRIASPLLLSCNLTLGKSFLRISKSTS